MKMFVFEDLKQNVACLCLDYQRFMDVAVSAFQCYSYILTCLNYSKFYYIYYNILIYRYIRYKMRCDNHSKNNCNTETLKRYGVDEGFSHRVTPV